MKNSNQFERQQKHLSDQQQVRLSCKIQEGFAAVCLYRTLACQLSGSLPGIKLLLSESLDGLMAIALLGKKAESRLISTSIGLVASLARKFWKSRTFRILELEDFMQEGCLGLLEAALRYNPNKNAKFSTYAAFWINKCVYRAAFWDNVVWLPEHILRNRHKYEVYIKQFGFVSPLEESYYNGEPHLISATEPESTKPSKLHLQLIEAARANLNDKEKEVLGRRFGTFGYQPEKNKTRVASAMGIGRATVPRMKESAIRKLTEALQTEKPAPATSGTGGE
ncbi:MAG: sigma-70 family RNA polymerase sigma factor [Oscillatoria sp. SIO1A7]|nr:sigma-70 family RNA polymerase sigma factor [Oscillatoria sp. SIO1A7]